MFVTHVYQDAVHQQLHNNHLKNQEILVQQFFFLLISNWHIVQTIFKNKFRS